MNKTHDGRKLRVCAVILAVILTIVSIALGVIQIAAGAEAHGLSDAGEVLEIVKGVAILIVGPFLAFVICLVLRGFGTIVREYENDVDEPVLEEPEAERTASEKLAQREKDRETWEKETLSDRYAERFGTDEAGEEDEEEKPPKKQKKRSFLNMIGIEKVEEEEDE